MFYANDLIKKIDMQINYLEFSSFYEDMSKVTDIHYFIQVMQTKEGDEKRKIEEGLIYLSSQDSLKDYEKAFLDKYHQYLIMSLENDVREYYNNYYCGYLFSKIINEISPTDNRNEVKFINGKSIEEIENNLTVKYHSLIERVYNDDKLEADDKRFIEETFLSMAFDGTIYKECDDERLMYDIVEFFKKYPIKDLTTPRNKQLDILTVLSSRMINFSVNSAIQFDSKKIYNNVGKETLGCFGNLQDSNETPYIQINGLDAYEISNDKEYLEKMFTVFHELGHFGQGFEEFTDEFKKVIEMEHYLIKHDRAFYNKYHDSFFVERDADSYAIIEFIKTYGEQYSQIVYNIVAKEQSRKRIDWPTFYLMELEEYGKTQQHSSNKSYN